MEAGGSPRSGRRLEAAHRVPARINDPTGRRSRSALVWPGSVVSAVLRGPEAGPKGRSLPRRSEVKAAEQEPAAALVRRLRGEGQFRAGPRLSRAAALPTQTQAAATGGIKLCGR